MADYTDLLEGTAMQRFPDSVYVQFAFSRREQIGAALAEAGRQIAAPPLRRQRADGRVEK